MELTAQFMGALENSLVTTLASITDLKVETDHFAISDYHFDMYYKVTVPRADVAKALQRLEASSKDGTFSTIVSKDLGTPVSIIGFSHISYLDQPAFTPTSIPREDAGNDKTRKYNRSFHT